MHLLVVLLGAAVAGDGGALVGIDGLTVSPAASDLVDEDVLLGMDDTLRAVVRLRGHGVAERQDDLFYRELVPPTVSLGGRVRRARCDGNWPAKCTVLVRWELYNERSRTVLRSLNVEAKAADPERDKALQDAISASLYLALGHEGMAAAIPARSEPGAPSWDGAYVIPRCVAPRAPLPAGVESVLDAVVVLRTDRGHGSGVVVSPGGHVATAAHLVESLEPVEVMLRSGLVLEGRVQRVDSAFDVALVDLPGEGWPCRPLAFERTLPGQPVFTIGSPLSEDLGWSTSQGIVSGRPVTLGREVLQTDAMVNPGHSGGPLLDAQGSVAGVISFKVASAEVEGLGFASPSEVWARRLGVEPSAAAVTAPMAEPVTAYPFEHLGTTRSGGGD